MGGHFAVFEHVNNVALHVVPSTLLLYVYPTPLSSCLNRYSVLPTISLASVLYNHIKIGAYNGDQFLIWLAGLLQFMNPYPHSVLILDNCWVHHVPGCRNVCWMVCQFMIINYIQLTLHLGECVLSIYHHILWTWTLLKSAFHFSSTISTDMGISSGTSLRQEMKWNHTCFFIMLLTKLKNQIVGVGFIILDIYNNSTHIHISIHWNIFLQWK